MTDRNPQSCRPRPSNKAGAERSSTDPVQLELFPTFVSRHGWFAETPKEPAPSRDFCLPASAAPARSTVPNSSPSDRQLPTLNSGEGGKP
jgi:hypothetical protein